MITSAISRELLARYLPQGLTGTAPLDAYLCSNIREIGGQGSDEWNTGEKGMRVGKEVGLPASH